jgi:hypothetical protein
LAATVWHSAGLRLSPVQTLVRIEQEALDRCHSTVDLPEQRRNVENPDGAAAGRGRRIVAVTRSQIEQVGMFSRSGSDGSLSSKEP